REALRALHGEAPAQLKLLFSVGPDFGKAMDQVAEIRRAGVRSVMLLPCAFPANSTGVANGARRIAEALGDGIVLYVKREGYIDPEALGRLVEEGAVSFVKYAVERAEPFDDTYLDSLVDAVGTSLIASGMGETPIADHIGRRKLATFTSGAV